MATEASSSQLAASWPWDGQTHHYSCSVSSATISGTIPEENGRWDYSPGRVDNEVKTTPNTIVTSSNPPVKLNRDLSTRNLSIVGLVLAWVASIAALSGGIFILASPTTKVPEYLVGKIVMVGPTPCAWPRVGEYLGGHRVLKVNEFTMVVLPLLFQILITIISGCLNSIHSTTLRWALWQEGRLRYNSNLRLFTSSKRNGPNKWPANVVAIVGLVLAYGGASVLTFPVSVTATMQIVQDELQIDYNLDGIEDRNGIDFNGWGLVGLGAGLLLQSIISTWALLDSAYVGTWNGNPLATARACRVLQDTIRDPLQSTSRLSLPRSHLESDIELLPSSAFRSNHPPSPPNNPKKTSFPVSTQPSALSACPPTRTQTNILWATSILLALLTLPIPIRASRPDAVRSAMGATTSLTFVERYTGRSDPWYTFQFFGIVESMYNENPYDSRGEYIGLLIQCAVLALPMLGLHVAGALIQMQRDEKIWRRASTVGVNPDGSLILQGLRSWETWVVFLSRAVVPWLFGFGISCNRNIYFATIPMVVVAGMFLGLSGFVEWVDTEVNMQHAPPTSWHIGLIAMILRILELRAVANDEPGGPDTKELQAELIGLRVAVRKVEAKILGQIGPADWQRLNPDLDHTRQMLERLEVHIQGAPWEGFENGLLTPVQEVAACRGLMEDHARTITAARYFEPTYDGVPTMTLLVKWTVRGTANDLSLVGATAGAAFFTAYGFGNKIEGAVGILLTGLSLAMYHQLHRGLPYQNALLGGMSVFGVIMGQALGMQFVEVVIRVHPWCLLAALLGSVCISRAKQYN
ncbi:hypothetical protein B0T16DRAFT_490894 [Cercophora newfieldiana]|uniref:Uncharacterized protein n=1 Tax=Cercophora newfieldiana TaxID=92897 RepID=A0AA40CRI5_9PEZI|nr:hypothetical protein B0T16DRAFT_490894 [Cercophora newfieldiana]